MNEVVVVLRSLLLKSSKDLNLNILIFLYFDQFFLCRIFFRLEKKPNLLVTYAGSTTPAIVASLTYDTYICARISIIEQKVIEEVMMQVDQKRTDFFRFFSGNFRAKLWPNVCYLLQIYTILTTLGLAPHLLLINFLIMEFHAFTFLVSLMLI